MRIVFFLRSLELSIDKPGGLVKFINHIKEHFRDQKHDSLVKLIDTVYERDNLSQNVF
jgi:hypothetical protein